MPCKNKANVLLLSLNNTSICLKRVTNGIKPVHDTFTSTKNSAASLTVFRTRICDCILRDCTRCWLRRGKGDFYLKKRFNYCHFSSSLLYAIVFLHCSVKISGLWKVTLVLEWLFAVPPLHILCPSNRFFGLRIAMTAAGCREQGFSEMHLSCSIFWHCSSYFFFFLQISEICPGVWNWQ